MAKIWRVLFALLGCLTLLVALGAGCSLDDDDDDDNDDDDNDDDDNDDDGFVYSIDDVEVTWFSCSLYEGAGDGQAECSSTQMPLYWEDMESGEFTSYAKRLLSQSGESEGQLWLLHGGPGASGVMGFPSLMEYIQSLYPELDIYTIDPRGTGYSEYVGCPDAESPVSPSGRSLDVSEVDDCLDYLEGEYGEDLQVFNATYSAIDLAAYINATREEEKNVFVWGASGGTFWGNRYLQLFPDQANGIILEGLVPPEFSIAFQDEASETVGRAILDLCEEDTFCSSKLPDPVGTLEALYGKLEAGHCSELGLSTRNLRYLFDSLTYYYPSNSTVPALIYRLDRCNEADLDALARIFNVTFGGKGSEQPFSEVLFFNEMCSEIWDTPDLVGSSDILAYLNSVYDEMFDEVLFATRKGYTRNQYYNKWPVYDDALDDQWAQTSVPMLMLQGVIDPATPYIHATSWADNFNGPGQVFVEFPYTSHNVSSGTPISENPNAVHCAMQLFIDFMKDPDGELDTSCSEQALPLDFEGTTYGNYFFGTPDYWENPEEKGGHEAAAAELPAMYHHVQEELAWRLRMSCPDLAARYGR